MPETQRHQTLPLALLENKSLIERDQKGTLYERSTVMYRRLADNQGYSTYSVDRTGAVIRTVRYENGRFTKHALNGEDWRTIVDID